MKGNNHFYCIDNGYMVYLNLKTLTDNWTWNDYKLDEPSGIPIYYEVYKEKCYEYDNCYVDYDDIVVDIGANIGVFTRYAYQKTKNIYSIEPNSINYKCLQMNAKLANTYNTAISDKNGKLKLFIDTTSGGHSLYETDLNNTKTGKYEEVDTITLESFIENTMLKKIDFLKIDTEGAELSILNSISDQTFYKIKKIAMEYHHMMFDFDEDIRQGLIDRLVGLGYNFHMNNLSSHVQMLYFWR